MNFSYIFTYNWYIFTHTMLSTVRWSLSDKKNCSETTLTGESRFHISTPPPPGDWTRGPHDGKQTGGPLDQWNCVWMQWDCRLSTGLTPSSRLCRLWNRKEDLQRVWNQDRRAVRDQVGLSHCRHDGLVTVRDKAHLRLGYNDQSHRGHQCSKTMLTGESRFHISTPLGIEPRSLMTGSKWADRWSSGTEYEYSEIAGSPNIPNIFL